MKNKIENYLSKYWLRAVLRITIVQSLLTGFYIFWGGSSNPTIWNEEARLLFSILSLMQIMINCVMVWHESEKNSHTHEDLNLRNLLVTEDGIINNANLS
ncbi:MAG: hypothetical protein NTW25_00430 [Candidatus Kapabacteria bacterium]|nr:hypothetical protein [Candidatus Kapabacteria bacterium]